MHRALLATIAMLLLAAPPADARRTVPRGFFGVDYDREIQWAPPQVQASTWGSMAKNGVESARVVFPWKDAQPEADQPPSFRQTDALVANAAMHRVRLLPVVMYAPVWARVEPDEPSSRPADVGAYADYLTALVRRYGPRGSFWTDRPDVPRLPVRAWEVWNEPEMPYQWQPREHWAERYGELLRRAHARLRAADPGAKVVMAALANYSWRSLRELYRRGRIGGHFDVLALNPFTRFVDHIVEIVRRSRRVLNRHGARRRPIWVTEFGATASWGRVDALGQRHLQTTDSGLARLVRRGYRRLAAQRKRLRVGRAYWYTWASSYDRGATIFDFAGLWRYRSGQLSRRPALAAYRRSARAHEGCRKNAQGACR